jgi:hypothetical protein
MDLMLLIVTVLEKLGLLDVVPGFSVEDLKTIILKVANVNLRQNLQSSWKIVSEEFGWLDANACE